MNKIKHFKKKATIIIHYSIINPTLGILHQTKGIFVFPLQKKTNTKISFHHPKSHYITNEKGVKLTKSTFPLIKQAKPYNTYNT